MKVYKRKYRQLSERTKEKIRKSMTGKKKSTLHRKRISESLRTYWEGVKSIPYYNNESDKSSNFHAFEINASEINTANRTIVHRAVIQALVV